MGAACFLAYSAVQASVTHPESTSIHQHRNCNDNNHNYNDESNDINATVQQQQCHNDIKTSKLKPKCTAEPAARSWSWILFPWWGYLILCLHFVCWSLRLSAFGAVRFIWFVLAVRSCSMFCWHVACLRVVCMCLVCLVFCLLSKLLQRLTC
jgi:hypothetical protein